ncbi:YlbF family regulator [Desulforamulus reducens]|nr:YlbF family regulator [Desulforamulus reducens]
MSVYEMALELGKNLSTTEEYQRVLDTQRAVAMDQEARSLVKEFQQLQQSYQRMQMMGHQLTKENMATLEEMEKKATAHPLVEEYLAAQSQFYEVVNEVNVKIQEGLKGPEKDVPQAQGGCSCSSNDSGVCGGSCSGC